MSSEPPAGLVFGLVSYPDAGLCLVISLASDWRDEQRMSDFYEDDVAQFIERVFEEHGIPAYELVESTYELDGMTADEVRDKLNTVDGFTYDPAFEKFAAGPDA